MNKDIIRNIFKKHIEKALKEIYKRTMNDINYNLEFDEEIEELLKQIYEVINKAKISD